MKKTIDKEFERQKKIEETKKNLEELVAKYEQNENAYIALAARAKSENRISDYNKTLNFLRVVLTRKQQAKSMLHQFELLELYHDEAKASQSFMDSMVMISEETNKLFKNNKMKKVSKAIKKSSSEMEKNQMMMTMLLESTQDSLSSIDDTLETSNIDDEMQQRIDAELLKISNGIEKSLDEKLNDLIGNSESNKIV